MRHLPTAALIASLAAPALAEDCRLALVLAMDVSRSVDAADFVLQTEGLASALESDAVQSAIFGAAGDVALTVFQWSGERHQERLVDWTLVRRPRTLPAIAAAIRAAQAPEVKQLTALGAALAHGAGLIAQAPDCRRRVIDMAGDGQNNSGPDPLVVRQSDALQGITVNALAIGDHEMGLVAYFEGHLIQGPGAFVEVAQRHTDFPRAIRRKLVRELTDELSLTLRPRRRS